MALNNYKKSKNYKKKLNERTDQKIEKLNKIVS